MLIACCFLSNKVLRLTTETGATGALLFSNTTWEQRNVILLADWTAVSSMYTEDKRLLQLDN